MSRPIEQSSTTSRDSVEADEVIVRLLLRGPTMFR